MKKRTLSIVLTLIMLLSMIPTTALATGGEIVATIGEATYTDLHEALAACGTGETITLQKNVNLTGANWTPVANFDGTFDGNSKTITGLTVTGTGNLGLFASTDTGAVIKDLTISGAQITGSDSCVGVLAGSISGSEIINVIIADSTVTVTGGQYTGGLTGIGYPHAENCTVSGCTITGYDQVGGFVGYLWVGGLKNCTATNNAVKATSERAGGLIGKVEFAADNIGPDPLSSMYVDNNTVTGGSVTAPDFAGGIAGQIMGDDNRYTIQNNQLSNVALSAPEFSPVGTIRKNQNNTFMTALGTNVSGNTWNMTAPEQTMIKTSYGAGTTQVPVYVFAEAKIGDTKYTTLAEAVAAARDGDTITLLDDVEISSTISVAKSLTIDGTETEKHKLTYVGSGDCIFHYEGAGKVFALQNCRIINSGTQALYGGINIKSETTGKVVVDHCEFGGTQTYGNLVTHDSGDDDHVALEFTYNMVDINHGSLLPYLRQGSKIVGNTFKNIGKNRVASIVANDTDTIVVTDNVFEGCTKNGLICVNLVGTTTNLQIKNNTYTNCTGNILRVESTVVLTPDSEIVNTAGQDIIVVKDAESEGKLTISGGKYVGKDAGFTLEGEGAILSISGGIFNSDPTACKTADCAVTKLGQLWYVGTASSAEISVGNNSDNVGYIQSGSTVVVTTEKDQTIEESTSARNPVQIDVSAVQAEQITLSASTVQAIQSAKSSRSDDAEALTILTRELGADRDDATVEVTFSKAAVDKMAASATDTVTLSVEMNTAASASDISEENKQALSQFLSSSDNDEAKTLVMNISLVNEDGTEILSENAVNGDEGVVITVRVKAPEGSRFVTVYYMNGGTMEAVANMVSVDAEGYITIELNHFSEYALVGYEKSGSTPPDHPHYNGGTHSGAGKTSATSATTVKTANTGDMGIALYVGLGIACLLGACVAVYSRKRRRI